MNPQVLGMLHHQNVSACVNNSDSNEQVELYKVVTVTIVWMCV